MEWISAPDDPCRVLRRPAEDADPHVLAAMNMGDSPVVVEAAELLISSVGPLAAEPGVGYWLPPDTAAWLR
jgi:hypothetical protein